MVVCEKKKSIFLFLKDFVVDWVIVKSWHEHVYCLFNFHFFFGLSIESIQSAIHLNFLSSSVGRKEDWKKNWRLQSIKLFFFWFILSLSHTQIESIGIIIFYSSFTKKISIADDYKHSSNNDDDGDGFSVVSQYDDVHWNALILLKTSVMKMIIIVICMYVEPIKYRNVKKKNFHDLIYF